MTRRATGRSISARGIPARAAMAAALALALAACGGASQSAPGAAPPSTANVAGTTAGTSGVGDERGWPRTVTVSGSAVELAAPPQRIVATSTEVGDLALELVGPERVAAVAEGSVTEGTGNQLAAAARVGTVLGGGTEPDPEMLLSLEPDLVLLVGRHAGEQDVAGLLGASGVPTIAFSARDFASPQAVMGTLTALGDILGAEDEAARITDHIRGQVDQAVADAARAGSTPRTVVLLARGGRPMLMGAASATTELVTLAGGASVAAEQGWAQAIAADPEAIIAAAPEGILVQDFRDQGLAPFSELL